MSKDDQWSDDEKANWLNPQYWDKREGKIERLNADIIPLNGNNSEAIKKAHRERLLKELEAFPDMRDLASLRAEHQTLRPPILDGLVREQDVFNVIGAPKTGKSWLSMSMALAVATGDRWLDRFQAPEGGCGVLYVDNELHPSDFAYRFNRVLEQSEANRELVAKNLRILSFRGVEGVTVDLLTEHCNELFEQHGMRFGLIILDTLSKLISGERGADENSNMYMRKVYSKLEYMGYRRNAAIGVIHHSSKGDQSEKSITDMGSGAGAQSRAADCHMSIRPHAEPDMCVLDYVARTFPPSDGLSIQFDYPLWLPCPDVAPTLGERNVQRRMEEEARKRDHIRRVIQEADGSLTANGIRDRTGYGVPLVRKLCAQLGDNGFISIETEDWRGREVTRYSQL